MGPEEVPASKESVEALEMVKLEAGQVDGKYDWFRG